MKFCGFTNWYLAAAAGVLFSGYSMAQDSVQNWNVAGSASWNADENWNHATDTFFSGVPRAEFDDKANIGNGGTAVVSEAVPDFIGLTIAQGTVDVVQGGVMKVVQPGEAVVDDQGVLRLSGNGAFESGSLSNTGLIELVGKDVSFRTRGGLNHEGDLRFDVTTDGNPVLNVGDVATLGGTVSPRFGQGIELSFGDSFEFLKADTVTGTSAVLMTPDADPLPRGLSLQVTTSGGSASIAVGNLPVLSLDRRTGKATISNIVGGPLSLTGYSIGSENGLLDLNGWNSLNAQQVDGWTLANPLESKVAELNLSGESMLEVGGASLDLGNLFEAALGLKPVQEDLTFAFSTADGRVLDGLVEYTGPVNDLVLRVDPESGQAVIRNLSTHIDPFDVTGYSIRSASGSLTVESWNSFQDSGAGGEGWAESNPRAEALAELNLSNSQVFSTGTSLPLGGILTSGGAQDLAFEFSTINGDVLVGAVEYGEIDGVMLPGDCNGDGVVDAADLACVSTIDQRDIVLAAIPSLPGDLDGNGDVAFPDFLVLSANFGQNLPRYTDGNIDLAGGVAFPDFLVLSSNFGRTPAAGATAAAVPEPSSLLLLGMVGLMLTLVRQRGR